MKKISVFVISILMVLSVSITAFAADDETANNVVAFATDEEQSVPALPGGAPVGDEDVHSSDNVQETSEITSPVDYWDTNGWPDDVSFAYEAGGELAGDDTTVLVYWEIGVVNASQTRKKEITSMFADTCIITFHDVAYSHAQREATLLEIETQVKESKDANFVYGYLINNTAQVYVVVKDEAFEEYSTRYAEQYGDMIWTQRESEAAAVETELGGVDTGLGLTTEVPQSNNNTWLFVLLCTFVLAVLAMMFYFRRVRLVPAKQTANGSIVTGSQPLSRSQTVEAIKSSEFSPRDAVQDSIREKIEGNKK